MIRPRPPADLISVAGLTNSDRFVPAPEVSAWIKAQYTAPGGSLYFEGHQHLESAKLGVLWTNCANRRHMRTVLGQAELVMQAASRLGVWQRARHDQQLIEWFEEMPDFLITLDAVYCDAAEDLQFAALIDHEMCHCAQQLDEHGMPKFDRLTGFPKYAIRGHDVEEFVSVVRRFGVEAAGASAVDLVIAAAAKPMIGPAKLAQACGTCLRLAA